MHLFIVFTTLLFALGVLCNPFTEPKPLRQGVKHACQFPLSATGLSPRGDADPAWMCGKAYDDCGNGWCCSSGQTCAGEINNAPVCKVLDSTTTIHPGTVLATPFKNFEDAGAMMASGLAAITATGVAKNEGAVLSELGALDTTAAIVAGLWGAAALTGAGWFLVG